MPKIDPTQAAEDILSSKNRHANASDKDQEDNWTFEASGCASLKQVEDDKGPAPYGYRRGREGEPPLVVEDRESIVVQMIFRQYVKTRSTGKVVAWLHSKDIMTRKGNKWSQQAIAIILSNRTYRGRVSYGALETQGVHDPIVDPALFYKANAIRELRQGRRCESDKPISQQIDNRAETLRITLFQTDAQAAIDGDASNDVINNISRRIVLSPDLRKEYEELVDFNYALIELASEHSKSRLKENLRSIDSRIRGNAMGSAHMV